MWPKYQVISQEEDIGYQKVLVKEGVDEISSMEELWQLEKDLQGFSGARGRLCKWLQSLDKVSIVIPVLNEEKWISRLIFQLSDLRPEPQLIFVDGGSQDATVEEIRKQGIEPICLSEPNRGCQLNAGLKKVKTPIVIFLHVDTFLTQEAYEAMLMRLEDQDIYGGAFSYGLEGCRLDWRKCVIEAGVWFRNHVFKIAHGDQAFFIKTSALEEVGSYKALPIMEDVEWFERLKKTKKYVLLKECVYPSPRGIFRRGWIRSSLVNISFVTLYKMGVEPETLARHYHIRGK